MTKAIIVSALCFFASTASAQSKKTFAEAEKMLGTVPLMLKLVPESAVEGAWAELRDVQLSNKTALPPKYKELIGLAVAAQIPCHYCAYFHRRAAIEVAQAKETELKEAVAVAANTRHWGTFITGLGVSDASFQKDVDRIARGLKVPAKRVASAELADQSTTGDMTGEASTSGTTSGGTSSIDAGTATIATSPDEVYADIRKTWGFVPSFMRQFPRNGVAGAWQAAKGLELSDKTELPMKYKSLIGLAVSSQASCKQCVIFTKAMAKKAGASDIEINEAIAMASLTRFWSTILNGNEVENAAFRSNTDQIISHVKSAISTTHNRGPVSDELNGSTSGTTTE